MQDVIKQLKSSQLAKVYVIHGPETVWHDEVFTALQQRVLESGFGEWNWSIYQGARDFTVDDLLTDLATLPWGAGEKVAVLKNAERVSSEELERLANWLQSQQPAGTLALFFDKLDQRLKWVKGLLALGEEVRCEALQGDALARYITDYCVLQGKTMKHKACELFMEMVSPDLNLVHNELDKLISFVGERVEITERDVAVITSLSPGEAEQNAVFAMTDHIAAGDQKGALQVLERLLNAGESPFRILPLIERQLRLLLAAKTRTGSFEETAQAMGERSAYPLRKASQYAGRFTLDQLYEGFGYIVEADREMKLGSPAEAVLQDLVVRLTVPQSQK